MALAETLDRMPINYVPIVGNFSLESAVLENRLCGAFGSSSRISVRSDSSQGACAKRLGPRCVPTFATLATD